jgi:hypothetical protein
MVTVYLWDASTWTGVCGSLQDAQEHTAAHLGTGRNGRIEAALLVTAVSSLSFCYERTGRTWTARQHRDGTVLWDPVPPQRQPMAS